MPEAGGHPVKADAYELDCQGVDWIARSSRAMTMSRPTLTAHVARA
jgi:hypothetical protein